MVVVLRMKFCACKFGIAGLEIGINVFPGVGNFVVRHSREVNVVVNAWTSHQVQKKCEWGKKWKHYKELILNNSFSFLLTVSVKIIFKKTFFLFDRSFFIWMEKFQMNKKLGFSLFTSFIYQELFFSLFFSRPIFCRKGLFPGMTSFPRSFGAE